MVIFHKYGENVNGTECGCVNQTFGSFRLPAVLLFLPGLTADHRLFDKQVEAFESTYNLLAWDAPGHGKSRPFVMDFTLAQKAAWLVSFTGVHSGLPRRGARLCFY